MVKRKCKKNPARKSTKKRSKSKRKPSRKVGRPTRYKAEFCQKLIEFFDIEPWEERQIPHYDKAGRKDMDGNDIIVWTDIKLIPKRMPTLTRFAKRINVGYRTVYDWLDKKHRSYHKEFSQAFTLAKELRKNWLIDLGLSGLAPPASFKFVAINVTDMKDRQEHEIGGVVGTRELTKEELSKLIPEKVIPFENAIAT